MADRVGYVEPASSNQFLRTTQVAPQEHVQHVIVASTPSGVATVAVGTITIPTSWVIPPATQAVVPPATVAIGTMAVPTVNVVAQPTIAVIPPATVAVGTLSVPTVNVVPPATVAVGTLAIPTLSVVPPATVAVGTLTVPTVNVIPPATVSVATLAIPTINVVPPATVSIAAVPTTPVTGTHDRRFSSLPTTAAKQITASGIATLAAPAAGKRLRLAWLGLSTSQDNAGEVLAVAKFGASGVEFYRWNMGNPGAFSHWQGVDGAVDTALNLALSVDSRPVECNITYEEL